jgi:anti-sigma regulatory factor (Ser/Thr protein kinase)
MPDERPSRRAAVVCRHPTTLRAVTQALGAAGLGLRQAIAPGMLPRSQRGEFEAVLLDLDVDAATEPASLVQSVAAACPDTPVICLAGVAARQRLVESLAHRTVTGIVPKLGSWLDTTATVAPTTSMDGPDEQELTVALRRLAASAPVALGPVPYLAGATPVDERLISSPSERDDALQGVLALGQRLGLSEEKLRRVEVCADELILNALNDAPRVAAARGASAPTANQVRVRFGADGRTFAISVHDRYGAITRDAVAAHIGRVLEAGGPRPRPAENGSATGGAGLGLVLTFGSANQLVVQAMSGKFTEVTAAIHIAGSNKAALTRGSALHMYL